MTAFDESHSSPRIIKMAMALLQQVRPEPGVLVDIPCGTGDLSTLAVDAGWTVLPLDLTPENWRGPPALEVQAADMNQVLPLADDSADAIACCEGIEHIENPWLVIREFRRILRPDGTLVITFPNTIDVRQRLRVLRKGYLGHYLPKVPYHINTMGPFVLCHALIQHGFEIRQVTSPARYGGVFMNLLARTMRYRSKCELPADVREMLSSQDVLRGRTVGIAATLRNG